MRGRFFMKRQLFRKFVVLGMALMMAATVLVGCGSKSSEAEGAAEISSVNDVAEMVADDTPEVLGVTKESEALYFQKGVYVNYVKEAEEPSKTYFYVFSEDTYGHTDDGVSDMGLPFDCTQEEGKVLFYFGSSTEEPEVFVVTGSENGFVYGYFEGVEDREMVFEPVADADPAEFRAINYISDGDYVYEDANGWSVKYNPKLFEVNKQDNMVSFVYLGESAGTNMIIVTYDVNKNGKEVRDECLSEWGEATQSSEGPFPGAEEETGYWAVCPPAANGSGLYMTSMSRDYMGGSLTFEVIGHNSGNDELDIAVSDELVAIIDSLTFIEY